jgi:hypothetical protein
MWKPGVGMAGSFYGIHRRIGSVPLSQLLVVCWQSFIIPWHVDVSFKFWPSPSDDILSGSLSSCEHLPLMTSWILDQGQILLQYDLILNYIYNDPVLKLGYILRP